MDAKSIPVFGPMGLNIGGDLPEAVALATLAECHQILEARVAEIQLKTVLLKEASLKEIQVKDETNISATLRQVI